VTRGDVYDARLDPVEGSEQGGSRPIVVISRDAINRSSPIVVIVPLTRLQPDRRIYPSHVVVRAPEGGLTADSVLLAEQVRVLDKGRLTRRRGSLAPETLTRLDHALLIALDLPGQ